MQSKTKKYRIGSIVAGAVLAVILAIVCMQFAEDEASADAHQKSAINPPESGPPASVIDPPAPGANLQTMFASDRLATESEPDPETITALAELKDEIKALRADIEALNDKIDRLSSPPKQEQAPDSAQVKVLPPEMPRTYHVVQKGDTLSGIAEQHDIRGGCLIAWNRIPRPDEIHPGQRLRLSGIEDCIPFREWIQTSTVARNGRDKETVTIKPAPAGKAGGWQIMGMGRDIVIMTRDGGATLSFFRVDDVVPGEGRILKLDLEARGVQTTNGRIDQLF